MCQFDFELFSLSRILFDLHRENFSLITSQVFTATVLLELLPDLSSFRLQLFNFSFFHPLLTGENCNPFGNPLLSLFFSFAKAGKFSS
jgi:hypothetical protein